MHAHLVYTHARAHARTHARTRTVKIPTGHRGSAADTLSLHEAERWRDDLVDRDEALSDWLERFPDTDAQQLRSLVRQARKDKPAPDAHAVSQGLAPRQSRAYRDIFRLVREKLRGGDAGTPDDDGAYDMERES